MFGVVFGACTPTPPLAAGGQTTTTYGNTDPDDGDPTDVTDDGSSDGSSPGDPSDGTDPDPSDSNSSGPWDVGVPSDVGNPNGAPDGSVCTGDFECSSGQCYVVPFLGGTCGECNEDADCSDGGCSPPNPFDASPPTCNMGELGGGCQSDEACAGDLSCATALDLLGLIQLSSCSACLDDSECGDQICAPLVDISQFTGHLDCIEPQSLPQDAYCDLESNGDLACASGRCSIVDVMGLTQLGACGECDSDEDCPPGDSCVPGEFLLDSAVLFGSTCQ